MKVGMQWRPEHTRMGANLQEELGLYSERRTSLFAAYGFLNAKRTEPFLCVSRDPTTVWLLKETCCLFIKWMIKQSIRQDPTNQDMAH